MRYIAIVHVVIFAVILPTPARAQQSTLPPSLVALDSPRGEQLLLESTAHDDYFHLVDHFETQQTQSFCGVASAVIVLNALQGPAPDVAAWAPYRAFTQDNLFNSDVRAFLPPDHVLHGGMTLEQLAHLLGGNHAEASVTYASDTTVDAFRELAARELAGPGAFVIVNYQRSALEQDGYGHISPLAAYHRASDRFLILDVARYKYPPVWVTAAALFQAMNTSDMSSGRSRGFVVVASAPGGSSHTMPRARATNPLLRRVILTLVGTFAGGALFGGIATALVGRRRRGRDGDRGR